ncbi:MAG: hypothetical protein ACKO40_00530 [Planctomycetaceae bacterium]
MTARSATPSAVILWALLGGLCQAAAPVEFDGFGLGNFDGTGSIAAELERLGAEAERDRARSMPAVAVAMAGPVGRDAPPVPLTAELRSRIDRFDVAAGLVADTHVVAEGPARWMGRIGVSNERPGGRESVELRTIVGNNAEWGLLGVEVGPRVERRLGRGVTVFIDGKAEAQAMRSAETGWWSLPGTATDGASMVGVAARTGLTR